MWTCQVNQPHEPVQSARWDSYACQSAKWTSQARQPCRPAIQSAIWTGQASQPAVWSSQATSHINQSAIWTRQASQPCKPAHLPVLGSKVPPVAVKRTQKAEPAPALWFPGRRPRHPFPWTSAQFLSRLWSESSNQTVPACQTWKWWRLQTSVTFNNQANIYTTFYWLAFKSD